MKKDKIVSYTVTKGKVAEKEPTPRHGDKRQVPKPRKKLEMKICGVHACHMIFKQRPSDIIRAYVEDSKLNEHTHILKFCADNKRAYRVLPSDELTKVSESNHHEGICLLIKARPAVPIEDFLENNSLLAESSCIVALENVQNPHNLGAIMRVCANFGANTILLLGTDISQNSAAYRAAEGGAEWVKILVAESFEKAIPGLRAKGFKILGTSSHNGNSLYQTKIPKKVVFLFGSEGDGLSKKLMKLCDAQLQIPSTGKVESLNVACASSIILSEYWKSQQK